MTTTTNVVKRGHSFWNAYRSRGYFFREVAMLTIAMGIGLHLYRVIFGDAMTLQHVMTPTSDKILLIPMTYAAVTGIASRRRMKFVNKPHRVVTTAALAYIALSVPLHVYCGVIKGDVTFYVTFFGMWFSYLLLIVVYPVFLTTFWRLRYKN
jgi:hypothetical protein